MPKFTINIKGVGLAYLKDDVWRIIFAFGSSADCHKVKFISASSGHDEEVAGPDRQIVVTTEGASSTAEPGSGFDRFINLTEPGVTHDRLVARSGWPQHGVLMTIPDAVVSEYQSLNCRWGLKNDDDDLVMDYDTYAYSCTATIEATKMFIDIPGVLAQPIEYDVDVTVEIDNTCGQNHYGSEGDLSLLYDYIIQDPGGNKFTMERHPEDDVLVPPFGDEQAMAEYQLKLKTKIENPLKNDPGLPCNVYTSRETDDLP